MIDDHWSTSRRPISTKWRFAHRIAHLGGHHDAATERVNTPLVSMSRGSRVSVGSRSIARGNTWRAHTEPSLLRMTPTPMSKAWPSSPSCRATQHSSTPGSCALTALARAWRAKCRDRLPAFLRPPLLRMSGHRCRDLPPPWRAPWQPAERAGQKATDPKQAPRVAPRSTIHTHYAIFLSIVCPRGRPKQ